MKNIGKGSYWEIIFIIAFIIYIINLLSILFAKHIIILNSAKSYNYISIILSSVFMYMFFSSLKKGALTVKSIIILFCLLVCLPFVIAILFGGISI